MRITRSIARPLLIAALTACTSGTFAQSDLSTADAAVQLTRATLHEYLELIALPNDSAVPADIAKNTAWLENAFKKRGFTTRQLANNGKPMLYAEWPKKNTGAKTVLFYMHLDGMPVVPAEWSQPSPWLPVVKQRDAAARWNIVPTERLFAGPLDRELRVFARSTSDDKGPIMMFLAAFDGLKAANRDPAVNVKVLLDSEEEKGSPSIPAVVTANKELLKTDVIIVHDGPRHASERPTLIFGNRGAARVTLTVFGPRTPLHSGHYGNYVPNPALRLASLLASMKDDAGRVTVAGYYDRIKLSDAEKKILAETGDDEAAIRKRVGIARAESVGATLQESLQYPSLNVRGMAAAVGDKASNVIPDRAIAEFDLRTTPEAPPAYLFGLIEAHVKKQGYHLINGVPTDADRAAHDKIAALTMGSGGSAVRTPLDSPLGKWAFDILQRNAEPGVSPVRIRMMGGSVPTDRLVEILEAPFVILPLVNGDNNQHTFDENLRIGHYIDGVRTIGSLLRSPLGQ